MMKRLQLNILSFWGAATIQLLGQSMAWTAYGSEQVDRLYQEGRNIIIAFWHGQQLMMPLAYRGRQARILISQHRDGELIYRIVKRFGFGAIRGSTTRGGQGALRQLIRSGRQGLDLVITPDGPKGPRHRVQSGVVALAKVTGMPIIPLTFACSKKKSFSVGIALSSRIRFRTGSLCGATRFRLPATPMLRLWNEYGWSWKRPSRQCHPKQKRCVMTRVNSQPLLRLRSYATIPDAPS